MGAVKIENFRGMLPRASDRLLPENHAVRAVNIKALSGELRGIHKRKLIADFNPTVVRSVFRIDEGTTVDDTYITSPEHRTSYVKSPIANDFWRRYYFSGWDAVDYVRYNTYDRIILSDPAWRLGITAPIAKLSVVPAGGASATEVDRSYTYTLVSEYGEEGPPAEPSPLVTGKIDDTWALSGFDTIAVTERNITHVNIYRTEVGASGVANFHFVDTMTYGTATYNDNKTATEVASNSTLVSTTWFPPVVGLRSIQMLPNNFAVGFLGNTVYFSEVNRPHAWPTEYEIAFEFDIVQIVVFANSIAVLTNSFPIILTGSRPEFMAATEVPELAPCLSADGAVEMMGGVLFPSTNGLKHITTSGMNTLTEQVITKEEWLEHFDPRNIDAARYQRTYMAITGSDDGFFIDFESSPPTIVLLENVNDGTVGSDPRMYIQNDWSTGEILTIYDSLLSLWDTNDRPPMEYLWRSKIVQIPKPKNFGTAIALVNAGDTRETFPGLIEPLLSVTPEVAEDIERWLELSVYINEQPVPIYKARLRHNKPTKLPSKFKSDVWQFEVRGTIDVYSIAIAETGQELENV